ncbi:fimbrial protein [Proteus terrae]|uniref:fimbrial protein n=1 Tax=Proteus terrae TaxID=1574161 RepID=UPI002889433C|nr:fimbrial protein [Proteus terrae]
MKKVILATLITTAVALSSSAFAAGGQGQGSGQVKFHGYIIDAPCSIESDNPIEVDFNQISRKLLEQNGNTGESHVRTFNIELADCDISDLTEKQVTTTFSFTDAGAGSNLIGFNGKDGMGAGIAITSGGSKVLNNVATKPHNLSTGPNTLQFASYVKGLGGKDPIKVGEFYATANFTLAYQ